MKQRKLNECFRGRNESLGVGVTGTPRGRAGLYDAAAGEPLTRVSFAFIEHRINVYLRFGCPVVERRLSSRRSYALFRPAAVLGRMHWEGNEYGTTRWELLIVQACAPGKPVQCIAGVHPGARVLLHVRGDDKVQAALTQIDTMEAMNVHPADVSPDFWMTLSDRLLGRGPLPDYTAERHAAWLSRKEAQ